MVGYLTNINAISDAGEFCEWSDIVTTRGCFIHFQLLAGWLVR